MSETTNELNVIPAASCVLISGGSRGLGLAFVEEVLANGAKVAAFARTVTPELQQLMDANPERVYVGTCRANGCTEALYADRDHAATVVRCEKCTVEHPIADRRAELEAGVEDYLGTIKEISHLFRETFGEDVSIRRIYGYVDHGLIVARGNRVEHDSMGRPRTSATYRIGDVREAVRAMREDKAAAKGVRRHERARAVTA